MPGVHLTEEIERLQGRLKSLRHEKRRHDTWVTVEIARHKDRPRTRDYIGYLVDGFEELKGDRLRADDRAIVGGLGWVHGRAVLVVGHQKGRTLDEQTEHSFGMAKPEGYRKAQRLFSLAERHGLPVLTFVDTPGAYPGVAAEEGGHCPVAEGDAVTLNLHVDKSGHNYYAVPTVIDKIEVDVDIAAGRIVAYIIAFSGNGAVTPHGAVGKAG